MDERTKNEARGVTNSEADRAAMLERRRKAGDVLPFSPSTPCDRGEYFDRGAFSNNIPLPEPRCGVR
jgi:hypothetical protein